MKNRFLGLMTVFSSLIAFTSCSASGEKTESSSYIYAITTIISLLLVIYYCTTKRVKKNLWYYVLFTSVLVVNIGYLILSRSQTLEAALNANRLAYLGSTFLPVSMFLITLRAINKSYKKYLPAILASLAFIMFLIAASPGYLDIYYKEVSLEIINGVSSLNKVYGDFHFTYMLYLLGYFSAMVVCVIYAHKKKKIDSTTHAIMITGAVLINIIVWLIEQFIKIDVEFLSISYIISELFLLGLQFLLSENEKLKELINTTAISNTNDTQRRTYTPAMIKISEEKIDQYLTGIDDLTVTERSIYKLYITGKSTKEVMAELNIKENTLKFHNKNIYSKLGVSSRKELIELYKLRKDTVNEKCGTT